MSLRELSVGVARERGRSYRTDIADVAIHALDPSIELGFSLLMSSEPLAAHGLLARYGSGSGTRIEVAFVPAFVGALAAHLDAAVMRTGDGPTQLALLPGKGVDRTG